MVAIHFRNDERNVRLHPEVLGVAENELSRARECHFDFTRNGGIERGENDRSADDPRITGDDAARRNGARGRLTIKPARDLTVFLAGRSFRRREVGKLEPRMIRQQPHEHLADGTGRS
jgi:hypothetical protein